MCFNATTSQEVEKEALKDLVCWCTTCGVKQIANSAKGQ